MEENKLAEVVIGSAIEVHRTVGPGLLESVYQYCLCKELELRGVAYREQVSLAVDYKGARFDSAYRLDLLVNGKVIVELKAVESIQSVHEPSFCRIFGLQA